MGVNHQALPTLHLADDRIARNGTTTGRELHGHVFGAANHQRFFGAMFRGIQIGNRKQLARGDHGQTFAQTNLGQYLFLGLGGIAF